MDRLKVNNLFYIFLVVFLASCDGNKIFDSYQPIENNSWSLKNSINFNVDIQEVSQPLNVFLNIRNNNNYAFKNLYIISKTTFPDGVSVKDTLEYEMCDAFGNWLGDGITDVKNNKLYFLENHSFTQSGTYQFEFTHAMRKRGDLNGLQELEGIQDIGLRIEKSQN